MKRAGNILCAILLLGVGFVGVAMAGRINAHMAKPEAMVGDVAFELFGLFALALGAIVAVVVTARAGGR